MPLPPRDLLILLLTAPREGSGRETGPTLRLRLSADAELPRLLLQTERQMRPSGPPGPFFRRVVEELVGARLESLEQVRSDRLVIAKFTGTPSGEPRSLVLELTGRKANLVLLGPGERVLDVLVPPKAKASESPRLAPGVAWAPPPGAPRGGTDEPGLAESLAPPAIPPLHPGTAPNAPGDRATAESSSGEHASPGSTPGPAIERPTGPDAPASSDAPGPSNAPDSDRPAPHPEAPLSHLVEFVLGATVADSSRTRLRRDLGQRLDRKLKRARSLLAGLEEKAAAADGAERIRMDGELLKANMQRIRRGMDSLEVEDYFSDPVVPRTLELDPRRSANENVQRAFDRYHKLVRSQANVHAELGLCSERIEALAELRARVDAPDQDPDELEREAVERRLLERKQEGDVRKRKTPQPRLPYRRFTASRGSEIRVGRTARDNDELTLRHSKGSDLWLHTADAPGSHVVLRLEKGAEPDPEEVLDAAHLAVHFSPLRAAGKASVHVAPRKLVTKPKGAKAGLVSLSGGRTLMVRMQPQRLEGLLAGDSRRLAPRNDGSGQGGSGPAGSGLGA